MRTGHLSARLLESALSLYPDPPVAQPDRALPSGGRSQRFESSRAGHVLYAARRQGPAWRPAGPGACKDGLCCYGSLPKMDPVYFIAYFQRSSGLNTFCHELVQTRRQEAETFRGAVIGAGFQCCRYRPRGRRRRSVRGAGRAARAGGAGRSVPDPGRTSQRTRAGRRAHAGRHGAPTPRAGGSTHRRARRSR